MGKRFVKANTPQATFVKQGESRGRHIKRWMISFSLHCSITLSLNIQVGNCEVSNPLYSFILPYRLLRLRGTLPNIIKSFAFIQIFVIFNLFFSTWPWSLGSCCFPGWPYTGPKCSMIVINIFVIVMIHEQQKNHHKYNNMVTNPCHIQERANTVEWEVSTSFNLILSSPTLAPSIKTHPLYICLKP